MRISWCCIGNITCGETTITTRGILCCVPVHILRNSAMSGVPFTTPVRKGHEIDRHSLCNYLKANVSKFGSEMVSLLQFEGSFPLSKTKGDAGGQSNPTFYIKDDKGNEFVMRKKPPGKLLPSAVCWSQESSLLTVWACNWKRILHSKNLIQIRHSCCRATLFVRRFFSDWHSFLCQFLRTRSHL